MLLIYGWINAVPTHWDVIGVLIGVPIVVGTSCSPSPIGGVLDFFIFLLMESA